MTVNAPRSYFQTGSSSLTDIVYCQCIGRERFTRNFPLHFIYGATIVGKLFVIRPNTTEYEEC